MKLLNFIQEKIVTSIGVILFIFSCSWMLIEATSRQFFSKSFPFSEEIIVFSLIWAVLLTLGQSGKEGYHITVDLFSSRFKGVVKKISSIIIAIVGILYAVFLVYVGIEYIQHLLTTGITSQSSLRLPMGYVFLAVPLGMVFFALFYFQIFLEELSKPNKN